MPDAKLVYWDACVFLRYINGESDSLITIDTLLDQAERRNGNLEIITSTVTVTEVAFALQEQQKQRLSDEVEEKIDALWRGDGPVHLVGFHQIIARQARNLIRSGIAQGWSLKPLDAVHLATSMRQGTAELHTYDEKLFKYNGLISRAILRPYVPPPPPQQQPALL